MTTATDTRALRDEAARLENLAALYSQIRDLALRQQDAQTAYRAAVKWQRACQERAALGSLATGRSGG